MAQFVQKNYNTILLQDYNMQLINCVHVHQHLSRARTLIIIAVSLLMMLSYAPKIASVLYSYEFSKCSKCYQVLQV